MVEPRIVPRAEHPISRRDIDPDALKVLYRLRESEHVAYLVGGSVRDLLLGRRPKDFDIGTSAHPYQIKKLFRNCWIIGRRFRLAHVRFGTKVIEVATFRRQVEPGEEIVQDGVPAAIPEAAGPHADGASGSAHAEHLIHRDNTFGTPEEDAFRRDFTINALAYDIANFSIIDYVGGLDDLRAGVVRAIGDPEVRLREDPVRMLRAVALAARLDFSIDPPVLAAIRKHRHEIARSSAPRLLEEYYKILRTGSAEKAFRMMASLGLLEPISAELHRGAKDPLWRALANVDAYRRQFLATPDTFSNPILLGSLVVPLGISLGPSRARERPRPDAEGSAGRGLQLTPKLGELPLARRDVERLQQILGLQHRLHDLTASPRAQLALTQRSMFRDTLTWLEIHGGAPDIVEHWETLLSEEPAATGDAEPVEEPQPAAKRRRRRRRRRRIDPLPS
jgi:poly(A) polymerase